MHVLGAFVAGVDNGRNGIWNSQGSSVHESVMIVRVGGVFKRNPTNISDVSANVSFDLDVITANSTAAVHAYKYLNLNVSGGGIAYVIGGDHGKGVAGLTVANSQRATQIRVSTRFNTLDPAIVLVAGYRVNDD